MRFVDTNVLLYAVSRNPGELGKAEQANRVLAVRDLALSVTPGVMLAAMATRRRFGISYWDAAIIEAARAVRCDVVFSEDLGDGQDYAGVRIENPFHGS